MALHVKLTLVEQQSRNAPAPEPVAKHEWKHLYVTDHGWYRSKCSNCGIVGQHPPHCDLVVPNEVDRSKGAQMKVGSFNLSENISSLIHLSRGCDATC